MIKIYYNKASFKGGSGGMSETIFCMPFEDGSNWPDEPLQNNRFSQVIQHGDKYIQYKPIGESDFVVLPYKHKDSKETRTLIKEAVKADKKIIIIYNDDNDKRLSIPVKNSILFRTSFNASTRLDNEYPIPAFSGDFYHLSSIIKDKEKQMTIGFCGQAIIPLRRLVIKQLESQNILKTSFILRKGFWAPEVPKTQARADFINNLKDNLFSVCVRGAGNFSYRLYETMMMGRIPLIIDSDQVFPFENIINYKKQSIFVSQANIENIESAIEDWLKENMHRLSDIQVENRQIWEKYMSPLGWLSNFHLEL